MNKMSLLLTISWQVTSIYLALHKRQVLHHIKNGIERVDIAEIAKEMNEEAESTENSGLSDNVKMVFEINKSVSSLLQMSVKISVNIPICDRLTAQFMQWTTSM